MSTSTTTGRWLNQLRPENPECTAPRHNHTETTWRVGCRCPGAERAHIKHLAERAIRKNASRAAARASGARCGAAVHDTLHAWELGCRCRAALRARARRLEMLKRRAASVRVSRSVVEAKAQRYRERDQADPFVIDTLAQGTRIAGPRTSELIAAIDRMKRRNVAFGPRRWTPMGSSEIADRLGVSVDYVHRLRQVRAVRRDRRASRRLIEAQLRAFVVADAIGQKRQRAMRHAVMEAAAAHRRAERALAWKQHCRTMRRLRGSQARAKVVALAVQRDATC